MKKYFITGLVILLPLVLTIGVIVFLINLLTAPFMGFVKDILEEMSLVKDGFWFLSGHQLSLYGGKILVIITLLLFTIFLGIIGRWFFIHWFFRIGDSILHKIPVVSKVYKTSQDIIKTLFISKTESFKQVVMVPFPLTGAYCIGMISSDAPEECSKEVKSDMVSVFVPTTPNPTSGYLLMYRKEDVAYLDMKVEDAIKFIISCGMIQPGSL